MPRLAMHLNNYIPSNWCNLKILLYIIHSPLCGQNEYQDTFKCNDYKCQLEYISTMLHVKCAQSEVGLQKSDLSRLV